MIKKSLFMLVLILKFLEKNINCVKEGKNEFELREESLHTTEDIGVEGLQQQKS